VNELRGQAVRAFLQSQISQHSSGVEAVLATYDPNSAVRNWHAAIRAAEEFINIVYFGISNRKALAELKATPLDDRILANPAIVVGVRASLAQLFGQATAQRFFMTMLQAAALNQAFAQHRISVSGKGAGLDTVGEAAGYFQSRRRHMVSLLYTMPRACKGTQQFEVLDAFNVLMPQVELGCIPITSMHQKAVLAEIFPDFHLTLDSTGARASHWFECLETGFLEPERASVAVLHEFRQSQTPIPSMESVGPDKILSAAELRNNVRTIGAAYEQFGLRDSDFAVVSRLVIAFSRRCEDDYFIVLKRSTFDAILASQTEMSAAELEKLFVNQPGSYANNTNAYQPFVQVGEVLHSNVNLLTRFIYSFKNVHLGSRRRFQIHAGFIFEDTVKRDLTAMGYSIANLKRINRKEFDVVATRGDVIYNFQCKNNWVDLSKVEADPELFVRYNRTLVGYYLRALAKEKKREGLLLQHLRLHKIRHFVVSRFPVVTEDPSIIPYNMLDTLGNVVAPV